MQIIAKGMEIGKGKKRMEGGGRYVCCVSGCISD